jgi:hypothetical protein
MHHTRRRNEKPRGSQSPAGSCALRTYATKSTAKTRSSPCSGIRGLRRGGNQATGPCTEWDARPELRCNLYHHFCDGSARSFSAAGETQDRLTASSRFLWAGSPIKVDLAEHQACSEYSASPHPNKSAPATHPHSSHTMKTTFFALLSALTLGALAAPSQIARRSCTYACPQGYVTGETQNGLLQCSYVPLASVFLTRSADAPRLL